MQFATTLLSLAAITSAVAAQLPTNSSLSRGDLTASTTKGIQIPAGWYVWKIASPKSNVPGNGTLVASSRLVYAVYAEQDSNLDMTIAFRKSTDGGRNWSSPLTLHTLNTGGGALLNSEYETVVNVYAGTSNVYVAWMSNEHSLNGSDQSVWVTGSDDQGATWAPPLMVSTGVGTKYQDVNMLEGVVHQNTLSLCWLGDHVSGKPIAGSPTAAWTGNANEFATDYVEDVFYTRIISAGGASVAMVPEIAITSYNSQFNADWPSIDAQGNTVHIVWNDDSARGLPRQSQDKATCSATSLDGGFSWSPKKVHTPIYGGSWDSRWFKGFAEVDTFGGTTYVYTFYEDGRAGPDAIYMDRAVVSGPNLNYTDIGIVASNVPGQTEGFRVDVHEGFIALVYVDYSSRFAYISYDSQGGAEFVAGTAKTHLVQNNTPNWEWEMPVNNYFHDIDINGGVAVVVYEDCGTEDIHVIRSNDGGTTMTLHLATSMGSCAGPGTAEVDEPFCAVTANGDFNLIYVDDRDGGTNANNRIFITGAKLPSAEYDSSTLTLSVKDVSASDVSLGAVSFLLATVSGTNPGADYDQLFNTPAGPYQGFFVGINADSLTVAVLSNVALAFRPVAANGTASWVGIPPIPGIDISIGTFVPVGIDLLSYTDPVKLQ